MKTVGEILSRARQDQHLGLDQAEKATKIRKKYLEALEFDDWQKLPSLTYARGFIVNYAQYLGLTPEMILAVFRRQANPERLEKNKIVPRGVSEPLNEPFFRLTPSKIIGFFVLTLILLFFYWLFGQYQSLVWRPKLTLERPIENEIIKSGRVWVIGKTDLGATLFINGQEIKPVNGEFSQEIAVDPGLVTIDITATNKFGGKNEIKRTFQVEKP